MSNLDPGICRGCGADIVWALTVRGRKIPLDANPERRVVMVALRPGSTDARAQVMLTYMPHHATCPKASEFRKQDEKEL